MHRAEISNDDGARQAARAINSWAMGLNGRISLAPLEPIVALELWGGVLLRELDSAAAASVEKKRWCCLSSTRRRLNRLKTHHPHPQRLHCLGLWPSDSLEVPHTSRRNLRPTLSPERNPRVDGGIRVSFDIARRCCCDRLLRLQLLQRWRSPRCGTFS